MRTGPCEKIVYQKTENNDVDVTQLQLAMDALISWANEWQLSVSVNKCCVLNIGKAAHNTCLSINNTILPVVTR